MRELIPHDVPENPFYGSTMKQSPIMIVGIRAAINNFKGFTPCSNAPNPAGQSILGRFFEHGVNPLKLLIAALIPTIIMGICFIVFP